MIARTADVVVGALKSVCAHNIHTHTYVHVCLILTLLTFRSLFSLISGALQQLLVAWCVCDTLHWVVLRGTLHYGTFLHTHTHTRTHTHTHTTLCVKVKVVPTSVYKSLCCTATVLEGLFGEYHSSAAAHWADNV